MPTIGLSMIVRDEAHVIARCLDSVRSLVDAAVIVDTGSTDGTPEVVRAYLARHGIAGEVREEPWRDFAHNRNSALAALRARTAIDYALVIDADDRLVPAAGFDPAAFKAGLAHDVYDVDIHHGGMVYRRPQLFSNRLDFRYRSVLHEFLDVPPAARTRAAVTAFHVAYGGDGARSRAPDKYRGDAALLARALESEPDPSLRARYTFYLAQSHRDAGQRGLAIEAYLRRAELGSWDQEVFEALLNAGSLMAEEDEPTADILAVLERATAAVPARAEALYAAARICRTRGAYGPAIAAAARGLGVPRPEAGLFLRPWIYEHGLLDEYAVAAHWLGRDIDCLVACGLVLSRPGLDAETRRRVGGNRDAALDRLAARPSAWAGRLADGAPRIAVVTPYRREAPGTLRRCVASVRRQTLRADHILVAADAPQDWLDGEVARHVRLGGATPGSGNGPRAVGAVLAASAGYAGICLLDPACWYDPDHVESCLVAALTVGLDRCGIVTAARRFRRPDGSILPAPDESPDGFVGADGCFFLPRSFGLLAAFALMPAALDEVADRAVFRLAREGGFLSARTGRTTVNDVTAYAAPYEALGEPPPPGARAVPDHAGFRAWIAALPEAGADLLRCQTGLDLRALYGGGGPPGEGPDPAAR